MTKTPAEHQPVTLLLQPPYSEGIFQSHFSVRPISNAAWVNGLYLGLPTTAVTVLPLAYGQLRNVADSRTVCNPWRHLQIDSHPRSHWPGNGSTFLGGN